MPLLGGGGVDLALFLCAARAASRATAAWAAGVCWIGVWPNGQGERAPSPCGQTREKTSIAAAAAAINDRKSRSDMGRI